MFYALAKDEAYLHDKVSVFLAFAPVVHLDDPSSYALISLDEVAPYVDTALWTLGEQEIFPPDWTNSTAQLVCGYVEVFCEIGDWVIADNNPFEDNQERA